MNPAAWAIALFLLGNLLFALRRKAADTTLTAAANPSSDYVLAGRKLGGLALLATLAASNLSAFTIFGVPGAAYRSGWAFLPVMAFGTAFMAISFLTIGTPLRRLAAAGNWTTPAHFISARSGSRLAGALFSLLSLLYTLPYLAVQTGAAGTLINQLTGLSRPLGAALVAAVIALYVLRGGLRTVARTDIVQLAALIGLGLSAFAIIAIQAGKSGIWQELAADRAVPGPNARSGLDGSQNMLVLAGYYLLWSLANPMFPHFIQRFYAARSDTALRRSFVLYPLVCLLIFFPMAAIGVLGARIIPGLSPLASDSIFSLLNVQLAGPLWGPIFSIAALAALMSTMDSQLLSCSSILVEDFLPARWRKVSVIGAAGVLLSVAAWMVSLRPQASILGFLGSTAFPGYASLAPAALAALYFPVLYERIQVRSKARWTALFPASIAGSLILGTFLVVLQAFGIKPAIPAVIFNALLQSAILLSGLLAYWLVNRRPALQHTSTGTAAQQTLQQIQQPDLRLLRTGALLAAIFLGLGLDWWNLRGTPRMLGALPLWVWYHSILVVLMWLAFSFAARKLEQKAGAEAATVQPGAV